MSEPLSRRKCEPCHSGTASLGESEQTAYFRELHPRWQVEQGHHLAAHFSFADFREGLEFVNRVGELAEAEGHHPEITLAPDGVVVRIWTHAIDALSSNDFILAAKIDEHVD